MGLLGLPNAGKSTLFNRVLGDKLSIVSPKPQTTRNRVRGILTRPGFQAVLVDTPGIHLPRNALHRGMVRSATAVVSEVDTLTWVLDANKLSTVSVERRWGGGVGAIIELLSSAPSPIVALNKVDEVGEKVRLLPLLEGLAERLPNAELIPISARKGLGVDDLVTAWSRRLPEGPAGFPEDQLLDGSERFVVSELIREKLMIHLGQELPYACAVVVEQIDESMREAVRPKVVVWAKIIVERSSQKGIVIGRGGAMLKRIGTEARHDIETLLGTHVRLDLHVVVREDWTGDVRQLRAFGYEPG